MIYDDTKDRRPVRILRIATPADFADAGRDPGVYRASRSPGRVTVLCEYVTGPEGVVLCNLANMLDDANGMERSIEMDRLLGSVEGG